MNKQELTEAIFQSVETQQELNKKSNKEIARLLVYLLDNTSIFSPQADIIEVAAERLGHRLGDEPKPGMPKGYTFGSSECPFCEQWIKDNWYIRHINSNCKIGGKPK